MKTGFVESESTRMFYQQAGDGPDILWIPAGDQPGNVFEEQFAAFTKSYRCTSVDPRGAGQTHCTAPMPWQIADFAADCAALIQEVLTPPVVVTGLSLGALITQELALSYPELVRLAIPMGTNGQKTGFMLEWQRAQIAMSMAGGALPDDFATIHYALLSYPAEVLGDDMLWPKLRDNVASAYEGRDPELLAAQWKACCDYVSLDRLPDCQVPIHVINFAQDVQCPPSKGRAVAEAAADGHFHLLDGMGHFSMFGHEPKAVSDCIHAILAQYPVP